MITQLAPLILERTARVRPVNRVRPQQRVSLAGTIRETGVVSAGPSPVYRCVLAYDGGEPDLLFLGRSAVAGLTAGTRVAIQGTVAVRHGRLAVWNPRYQVRP
jgi:hypothetical protein